MNLKNEKQLLNVIRYALPFFILIISLLVTTFLYIEEKNSLEKLKKQTEEKFINDKKKLMKEQLENIYEYILSEQRDTEKNLKVSIQNRVNEAHKIVINLHKQYKKTLSKEQLRVLINTALKDIRFNEGRGYYFIYTKEGITKLHALLPELEGKNLYNYKDARGKYLLKESVSLLKNKEGSFQSWYWRKNKEDKKEYKKIGYLKNIYELNWFIGTGEYVDEFEKDVQSLVLEQVNKFRFGKNGYVFTFSEDDIYLSYIRKNLLGESLLKENNIVNINEILYVMRAKAKQGGGFVEYTQKINPINKKHARKIAYVKLIPKWNWLIGTGFYLDEVNEILEEKKNDLIKNYSDYVKKLVLIAILTTIILLILSVYISIVIERKFKEYKKSIEFYVSKNQKQYELLAQKSKLAAMGEMMENVAHQWRQPLSLIRTASSGVKFYKNMGDLTDKILFDSMDTISNSAVHLSETIDDFRDFFKPDKEKNIFTIENVIEKSLKLLSSQFIHREIEVIKNIQTVTIKTFERELLQVLVNIFSNGKDALEKKENKRLLFITVNKKEKEVVIRIKDNAGGISENIKKRIFEPYFTTKHKSQGTGLGLYMSQEIISRHMRGSLGVDNKEFIYKEKSYVGAEFIICLPLK